MSNIDTSSLSPADVQEYRGYFKLVHGRDTTLTHDELVSLVLSTEDDMEPADWAEAMLHAETEGDDRSPGTEPSVIEEGSAWGYAKKLNDPEFQEHLETSAQAALENKRGAAVIRRDLIRIVGLETIEKVWPIPGSTEKTHGTGGNNPRQLHKYPTIKKDKDGQDAPGQGDWYADLYDGTDDGKKWAIKNTSLKAVKAGETGKHILPEHAAIAGDEIQLSAARSALDSYRNNKKAAIVRTVNLIQRMYRINTETEATVRMITVDGQPEGEPVKSNKLVFIKNTKDETQFRVLTIGQLLAYDIDKARANGGTYVALIGTTGRQPNAGTGPATQNVKVDTIKAFDDVTSAYGHFFERLREEPKAMNAFLTHLNGAGSDDLLLSMNSIMTDIDSYLSKPGIQKRLTTLLAEGDGTKRDALKAQFAKGVTGKAA